MIPVANGEQLQMKQQTKMVVRLKRCALLGKTRIVDEERNSIGTVKQRTVRFHCSDCPRTFSLWFPLKRHILSKHGIVKMEELPSKISAVRNSLHNVNVKAENKKAGDLIGRVGEATTYSAITNMKIEEDSGIKVEEGEL